MLFLFGLHITDFSLKLRLGEIHHTPQPAAAASHVPSFGHRHEHSKPHNSVSKNVSCDFITQDPPFVGAKYPLK